MQFINITFRGGQTCIVLLLWIYCVSCKLLKKQKTKNKKTNEQKEVPTTPTKHNPLTFQSRHGLEVFNKHTIKNIYIIRVYYSTCKRGHVVLTRSEILKRPQNSFFLIFRIQTKSSYTHGHRHTYTYNKRFNILFFKNTFSTHHTFLLLKDQCVGFIGLYKNILIIVFISVHTPANINRCLSSHTDGKTQTVIM